jgi:hypothetical protein
MRLSQAQFAEAVRAAGNAVGAPNHCTKRLVQKWETGEHAACRPDYLRVLQAVTGLSARELGFRVLPDESGESVDADDEVKDTARTAIAAFAMSGMTEYASDSMIEASAERLRYVLEHPSAVDSRTAEFVDAATSRLFDLQHHSPSRLLAPTVDRHLTTVTALLTAARHEGVRRKLMISAGRSAMLAGWLALDRGDLPSTHRHWDTSISAAEGTTDAALLSASLTCLAYSAARRGDTGTAWQFAHIAASHVPADDPRSASWATARAALYAAQYGELDAAHVAMACSLALGEDLPSPRPGDGCLPWARSFDLARLLSSTAHTAAVLKDQHAADYAAQAVDALNPARVKSRAVVLAEAALTAATVGELELCLDWGSSAATLTRDMDVSIAADLLHEIVPILLPYSDARLVRELLPQLTRLNRTADLEDELKEQQS